jgi:molybdopterin/thiamine biosynthesis adenylyltransferase
MPAARRTPPSAGNGATLVVVGAGNIGSFLLPHLARLDCVTRLIIVDKDTYSTGNLRSQSISRVDVGRPKATVMARRLRAANPSLEVIPLHAALEDVPPALLAASIWLTCLDSRAARQVANERVYRLGIPLWIDAGVHTSGLLARVSVYTPGDEQGCLECLWSSDDYRDVAQSYACDGSLASPAATNGISALGALAGSLQALACRTALAAEQPAALAGRELMIDAATHKIFVTKLRRNRHCRFDHITRNPSPIAPAWHTLADLARAAGSGSDASLHVDGRAFVATAACPACHRSAAPALVDTRVAAPRLRCRGCRVVVPLSWEAVSDSLALDGLANRARRLSLRALGLREGDLITLRTGDREQHFAVRFALRHPRGGGDPVGTKATRHGLVTRTTRDRASSEATAGSPPPRG